MKLNLNIYEIIKTVNGYDIYRMKGTKGFYYIDLHVREKSKMTMTFKTQKAAIAWSETH
jgi:hypothetical protein